MRGDEQRRADNLAQQQRHDAREAQRRQGSHQRITVTHELSASTAMLLLMLFGKSDDQSDIEMLAALKAATKKLKDSTDGLSATVERQK